MPNAGVSNNWEHKVISRNEDKESRGEGRLFNV